jgi:hypothetical protein
MLAWPVLAFANRKPPFLKKCWDDDSVADPDPPDPHVFGPPVSGSGSFYH